MLNTVLWDVDGTMAETERDGHRVAFNEAFDALGLGWHWEVERYGQLLRVAGGRERLLHDMASRPDAPSQAPERQALADRIHARKNEVYAQRVAAGFIGLRPGVAELMEDCRSQGLRMGIATTTSRSNVDALLGKHMGPDWARHFAAVLTGAEVPNKKPAPDVYVAALKALDIGPLQAVAIEDSPGGVAAARAALVPVIVTRSAYFPDDTVEEAIAIGPGLDQREGWLPALSAHGDRTRVTADDLIEWHRRMDLVSLVT